MTMSDSKKYTGARSRLLSESGAAEGDTVVLDMGFRKFTGILMPKHKFSQPEIITIKLSNGYNLSINADNLKAMVVKMNEGSPQISTINEKASIVPTSKQQKPKLSVISTGGTIASYIDYRTGAVHPATTAQALEHSAPEISEFVHLEHKVLFNELSENLTPTDWCTLAREVSTALLKNNSDETNCGVIIPHGTDTMGYTAAALSFLLGPRLPAPVILVGSQRSSDRPSSDANQNLIAAAKIATQTDVGEVVVAMHSNTSDKTISIHRGTRVRKMHTSRRDAFKAVNESHLGEYNIKNGSIQIRSDVRGRVEIEGDLNENYVLDDKVCLIQTYPTITPEFIEYMAEQNHGMVIAGTGLGHMPSRLLNSVLSAIDRGVHIIMTSQCIYGRVNMNVYSNGRELLDAGVIPGGDMLPETAYVKLMWVLGQTKDPVEVRRMMMTDYVGELTQ